MPLRNKNMCKNTDIYFESQMALPPGLNGKSYGLKTDHYDKISMIAENKLL